MVKIVKTRKPHNCGYCGLPIPVGSKCVYTEGREPRYDGAWGDEEQVGIEYWKAYLHPETDTLCAKVGFAKNS